MNDVFVYLFRRDVVWCLNKCASIWSARRLLYFKMYNSYLYDVILAHINISWRCHIWNAWHSNVSINLLISKCLLKRKILWKRYDNDSCNSWCSYHNFHVFWMRAFIKETENQFWLISSDYIISLKNHDC